MMPPCQGCGKEIIFAKTAEGKTIPLDPVPATYVVTYPPDRIGAFAERSPDAMVTHFATCRNANEFSGSRKT